ncbi:MAG: MarR family transcriptional regulator [Clostridiales bacterium]|nr:MarR family transcriptional regulator [Clostridiales bacterium]
MDSIFIVGGAAIDITGKPDSICRERDSNLGRVRIRVGGVGHNIAKRLAALDYNVELVTAIGSGFHAKMVRESCESANVSLKHTLVSADHTGTYIGVFDEDGDMLVGISDMSVLDHLTPEYLSALLPTINESRMCVIDGNLSPESLDYLCNSVTVPLFYDPVSCAKSRRIGCNIGKCYAIKPNRLEAGFLSGKSCDTIRGIYRASDWLLDQGVQRVFISLGEEGVYWADTSGCGVLRAECRSVADTTGAGDAMGAAIIDGCVKGLSTEECARRGNSASAQNFSQAVNG